MNFSRFTLLIGGLLLVLGLGACHEKNSESTTTPETKTMQDADKLSFVS